VPIGRFLEFICFCDDLEAEIEEMIYQCHLENDTDVKFPALHKRSFDALEKYL
jgi:hypothetical protein